MALDSTFSAFGVSEIVDENMANAARVHAIEWGKDISARSMIAFGGAAPLHAVRLAEKLNIDQVIIPAGAGVGSAIGFLRAPISYEVVRSRFVSLSDFDAEMVNELLDEMSTEAREIVSSGAGSDGLVEHRLAYMRYHGQGHEIVVPVPVRQLTNSDAETLRQAFESEYSRLYGRSVPGQQPEVLSWTLSVTAPKPKSELSQGNLVEKSNGCAVGKRQLFDPETSKFLEAEVYNRCDLSIEFDVPGPAIVVESQTTTIVSKGYSISVNDHGHLILSRQSSKGASE
jgi:N-methylhydantoinase A